MDENSDNKKYIGRNVPIWPEKISVKYEGLGVYKVSVFTVKGKFGVDVITPDDKTYCVVSDKETLKDAITVQKGIENLLNSGNGEIIIDSAHTAQVRQRDCT